MHLPITAEATYTATIGILDAFFESKGFISPAEFRNFCGPVVPLFKAKRIFTVGEILHAQLDLYDYGEKAIPDPTYKLTLFQRRSGSLYCKDHRFPN
ncbi:MAG: hypothetical protein V8Q57_01660 [Blautia sp.]